MLVAVLAQQVIAKLLVVRGAYAQLVHRARSHDCVCSTEPDCGVEVGVPPVVAQRDLHGGHAAPLDGLETPDDPSGG